MSLVVLSSPFVSADPQKVGYRWRWSVHSAFIVARLAPIARLAIQWLPNVISSLDRFVSLLDTFNIL